MSSSKGTVSPQAEHSLCSAAEEHPRQSDPPAPRSPCCGPWGESPAARHTLPRLPARAGLAEVLEEASQSFSVASGTPPGSPIDYGLLLLHH